MLVLKPEVHRDERGFFVETWNRSEFHEAVGSDVEFVQDNQSRSARNVLRGLHHQTRRPQGKLLRVVSGAVYDVAVDLRRGSETFGQWAAEELSAENHHQLWAPAGCGHGFVVLSDHADLVYKVTDYHDPEHQAAIRWDDPDIGIDWRLNGAHPILSARDANAPLLRDAELPQVAS